MFRIFSFILIVSVTVIVPSLIRSTGIYRGEIYRFQEYLGGDKVVHGLIGCALTLLLLSINHLFEKKIQHFKILFFAISVLVVEELIQYFLPHRHFELIDMGFGFLGAFMGFCVFFFGPVLMRN